MKTYELKLNPVHKMTDDGLLMTDIKILSVGKWNNTNYTIEELERAEWRDSIIWDRHYTSKERDHTNIVGHILNKRIIDNSIVGDILISSKTESGIEAIRSIEDKKVRGVSVEHLSSDYTDNGQIYATRIHLLGAALVFEPACKVCVLEENKSKLEKDKMTEEGIQILTDKIAELELKISELQKVDIDAVVTEQSRKDSKIIAELSARVQELEDAPVQNTVIESADVKNAYRGIVSKSGEVFRN